jgi:hypothetical protein
MTYSTVSPNTTSYDALHDVTSDVATLYVPGKQLPFTAAVRRMIHAAVSQEPGGQP